MRSMSRASLERDDDLLIAGRYRRLNALGKGGAAQVYRVFDTSSGKELALKQLHASASPQLTALFEREYQILAGLKHPRIVEVFDYGRDESGTFYTMELLEGEDLKERAPLPWREACVYLRDAAQALGLLHARKLVHRDVSPRNLWRTPDGGLKLIDFGAVAPFGPVDHVMGTPPLVPPEALSGGALDQRSDLYALGAVAYYLLTGMHAFPANDLRDLPEYWAQTPPLPSQCVAELERADLGDTLPPDLDTLVMALLSADPLARPASTAELIDRLDTLLGARRHSQTQVAEEQLSNTAFVGRRRERRRLRRMLLLASEGRGQSWLIESEPGIGRSRLLREFALSARVAPATVLHVDAGNAFDLYGTAGALALKLLDALPSAALAAARPYAGMLAHVSPRLRERLGVKQLGDAGGELRVRVQAALRDWFLSVAKQHTLVVLVDGLEHIDDGSAAFLLALALERKKARLLLAYATLRDRRREVSAVERALAAQSRRLTLAALAEAETHELLHSVFGQAEHLARLANRLARASGGNPAHIVELTQQLVRRDVIGFAGGSWVLPQEIPNELLSASRDEAVASRLDNVHGDARMLGRVLSLSVGVMSLAQCEALAKSVSEALFRQLGALIDEEILVQEEGGVRFAHERLRLLLLSELELTQRKLVQRALAAHLLAQPNAAPLDRLRAGLHLLDSGDERGGDVVAECAKNLLHEPEKMGPALPALEEALALMRKAGRPKAEQLFLLATLASGGYYVDRRYATRHGETSLETLRQLLSLPLAIELRRFLGRKLALIVALVVAGARFRRMRNNPRVPSFREAMMLLFHNVATLTGTTIICLDPKRARRYADVIEPLTALGPKHVASLMHSYCRALADTVRDACAQVYPRWQEIIALLDSDRPIRGLSDSLRLRYLAGALYARGVLETYADDANAVATAARLDALGMQLYRLSAHQVRTLYYANQGNLKLFEHHRAEAEQLAIQQGTIWQVETWSPSALIVVCLRTHDAMGMKHAAEQLSRISQEVPSLDPYARRSRGTYLVLRKRYNEALPWLEECLADEPRQTFGWGRSHGTLARAYNRLGDHEKARATCLRALACFDEHDLRFVALNLMLETELAIAEAGLGRSDDAKRQLEALLVRHTPNQGPLTLGHIHETFVEVALLTRDGESAKHHLAEMQRWYLGTGAGSLAQRCHVLTARVFPAQRRERMQGEGAQESDLQSTNSSYAALTVDRLLAGGGMLLDQRAHKALQIIAENTRCAHGFLFLLDEHAAPQLIASLKDEHPTAPLVGWLKARFARELEEELTQMLEEDSEPRTGEANVFEHGGTSYRVLLLFAAGARAQGILGAAVMASEDGAPGSCSAEVLGSIARHLQRALRQTKSVITHIS